MAEGQIIRISGSGAKLGFLAAANNSPQSGTGTVYYTDGTTSTFSLGVGNFWYPPQQSGNPPNVQVAAVNYANYPTGSSGHTIYVFEQSVPIAAGKTVEAVALPASATSRLQRRATRVRDRDRRLTGERVAYVADPDGNPVHIRGPLGSADQARNGDRVATTVCQRRPPMSGSPL